MICHLSANLTFHGFQNWLNENVLAVQKVKNAFQFSASSSIN